ncbi:MAG: hypothetical protein KKC20_08240 [Proteobacteria bacterium]|nr:hypothetical protein [Pseudomonadota bacterium]
MDNWIEICKAGTWTAKNGSKVTLTTGDLDNVVASYDPTVREAPLVFGHPEDNQPAFGWAQKLKRSGEILLAQFQKVPEAVKELVRAGHYKKVSISLGADKKTLRHVGLLGAVQPAVPGLKDVKFEGEDGLTIEFSNQPDPNKTNFNQTKEDDVEKKELEEKLAAEEKARKEAEDRAKASDDKAKAAEKELSESKQKAREGELETRIDKLVGNKILAKDKPMVKKIALALGDTGEEIEFSDGQGKKGLDEHLFDFLSGLPDLGLTTEFSDPGNSDRGASIDTSKMMTRV